MEKDQVRGNDSLVTFEEILQIAKEKNVSLHNISLSEYSIKKSDEYICAILHNSNFTSLILRLNQLSK